jgi:alkaline phosphatase
MSFPRRTLLTLGAIGTLSRVSPAQATASSRRKKTPKNIIFCVSDGMPISMVTMADYFQQELYGRPSFLATLMDAEDVTLGWQETRSLSSVVTDSSAASSAWSSGQRICNGQVNAYPDGTLLRPIASLVSEKGGRVGLVTTTRITHATPAGFGVAHPHRDDEDAIAMKYLASGVDILMGGGNKHFDATKRADKTDLYATFQKAGFAIAHQSSELKALSRGNKDNKKVLGVFSDSHLPYTVDHPSDAVPTLAQMASKALELLKGAPKGFLLQIEGGRVDHAGHANDAAAMLREQIGFEEAVKVAVDFARADGDTLVVITADHATGGPALNGFGEEYSDSALGLRRIGNIPMSYELLLPKLKDAPKKARDIVAVEMGIALTEPEADVLTATLLGKPTFAVSQFYKDPSATLGVLLGNHIGVTWTSLNHTADHVLVAALGPGSEGFSMLTPNKAFYKTLCAPWDIRYENPTMDVETAQKYLIKHS